MSDEEGPSEADLEAFDSVTRVCPECKTEVYDEATVCHSCGHAFAATSDGLPTWAVATVAGLVLLIAVGLLVI